MQITEEKEVKVLSNGLTIWKRIVTYDQGPICIEYFGQSCGIDTKLWDTCIGTKEELQAILEDIEKEGFL